MDGKYNSRVKGAYHKIRKQALPALYVDRKYKPKSHEMVDALTWEFCGEDIERRGDSLATKIEVLYRVWHRYEDKVSELWKLYDRLNKAYFSIVDVRL